MPNLSKRECHLAGGIRFRVQFHGDEPVKAGDLTVSNLLLTDEELCEFLQEKLAWRALFVKRGSKPAIPLFRRMPVFYIEGKVTDAKVSIFTGVNGGGEIKLGLCNLKSLTLTPQKEGGLTALGCMIQSTPTLDKSIAELIDHMDADVFLAIEYEHEPEQVEAELKPAEAKGAAGNGEGENFEKDARAQVEAFERGRSAPPVAGLLSDRH